MPNMALDSQWHERMHIWGNKSVILQEVLTVAMLGNVGDKEWAEKIPWEKCLMEKNKEALSSGA